MFSELINYLLLVLKATALQLFTLLGALLVLSIVINYLSRKNRELGVKVFGYKGYIYGFAWLGTSIHEVGHAVFALLFGHKVTKINLFGPDSDGTLGYVQHSYNPKNSYHRVGNFFIGIGPILFGSIVLYFFMYYIFGNRSEQILNYQIDTSSFDVFNNIVNEISGFFSHIVESIIPAFNILFSYGWYSLIIIYILYSIVSSISLSSSDIKGSMDGFIFFVVLLLIVNLATIWFSNVTTDIISFLSRIIADVYVMLILGILLSIVFIIMLNIFRMVKSMFS